MRERMKRAIGIWAASLLVLGLVSGVAIAQPAIMEAGVLVDKTEAGLERLKQPAIDRPPGVFVVPGVADVVHLAGLLGVLDGPNDIALLKDLDRA